MDLFPTFPERFSTRVFGKRLFAALVLRSRKKRIEGAADDDEILRIRRDLARTTMVIRNYRRPARRAI